MASLNKVLLIGNLTRDPELRYTPSGTAVGEFGLAVSRRFKDRNSNEWREDMSEQPIVVYSQDHPNVVLTPHIGGGTYESCVGARIFSAKKLVHFLLTGEELAMP